MESSQEGDGGFSTTLQLLSQYNDHTLERDRTLEYIEKKNETADRLSYDDLFKENIKLKLQLHEYEIEISSLKKMVEHLKSSRSPDADLKQQIVVEEKANPILPPRSAERNRNTKNLTLPLSDGSKQFNALQSPGSTISQTKKPEHVLQPALATSFNQQHILSPTEIDRIRRSSSSYSNVIIASPATSVAYTTSRISPSRSNKTTVKEVGTPIVEKQCSPGRINRVTALINDELHSPLKQPIKEEERNVVPQEESKTYPKSPLPQLLLQNEEGAEISPSSRQKIDTFANMLDSTFGEEKVPASPLSKASTNESKKDPDPVRILGSPVTLKKPNSFPKLLADSDQQNEAMITNDVSTLEKSSETSPTFSTHASLQGPFSPKQNKQRPSFGKAHSASRMRSSSINTTVSTGILSIQSDIPLFIQPSEFDTVRIEIISTLYRDVENHHNDENSVLFSIIDRKSDKEIFKFSKTVDGIIELDTFLKSRMDPLLLNPLPDRHLFNSNIPIRVDYRREKLNDYFTSLFILKELPLDVSLRLAKFISTDTVMAPLAGDTLKEGSLLVRKNKTLGSANNWRARYAILEGQTLQLLDRGITTDTIKIPLSTIELQANLPDDKYGTKNGFVINEHKKSGLSSVTRYYFCSETSKERESWVSILNELVENSAQSGASLNSKSESSSIMDHSIINETLPDTGASFIGPMANLQSSAVSSPSQHSEGITPEDERESKRSRMRSFFPFKKLNLSQISSQEGETSTSPEESGLGTSLNTHELTIAKSLQALNLSTEPLSNVVFGSDLHTSLSLSSQRYQGKYSIPSVVYRCLEFLYRHHGIEEEGIFRISGSSVLIKSLQEQFDSKYDIDLCTYNEKIASNDDQHPSGYIDVNTIAGLLKLYFRKLPHLIFGDQMFLDFKDAADRSMGNDRETALRFRDLIKSSRLLPENLSLMFALFELLVNINKKSRINKMNLRNLCIVFSPTLNIPVNVLQPFIVDFNCIFNGENPVDDSQRKQLDIHIPQM
ncbi:LAFE_0G10528g1_1 [Lachancea fermentati]|uniref:LAFE_0G10528g1_1 n=1 Tax=Lachancea fermentati TaxID=4955 RepID=A0A1G4MHR6_LACFM|nr:LAFE_0G10528g1_1 [Lachancea fermentati]